MNKIFLVILIAAAASFITYGVALAPSLNVQLAFMGFFTDKDQFTNFECACANPLPGTNDPSSGFSNANCPTPANIISTPILAPYPFASNPNICT